MSLLEDLEAVRASTGALTPEHVVDAATPEDHPLHSRFDWDDASAAHAHRMDTARELIRSVRVQYLKDDRPTSTRFYASMPTEDGRAYEPLEDIARDPLKTKLLLQIAEREWKAMFARYGDLSEFINLVRATVDRAAA